MGEALAVAEGVVVPVMVLVVQDVFLPDVVQTVVVVTLAVWVLDGFVVVLDPCPLLTVHWRSESSSGLAGSWSEWTGRMFWDQSKLPDARRGRGTHNHARRGGERRQVLR